MDYQSNLPPDILCFGDNGLFGVVEKSNKALDTVFLYSNLIMPVAFGPLHYPLAGALQSNLTQNITSSFQNGKELVSRRVGPKVAYLIHPLASLLVASLFLNISSISPVNIHVQTPKLSVDIPFPTSLYPSISGSCRYRVSSFGKRALDLRQQQPHSPTSTAAQLKQKIFLYWQDCPQQSCLSQSSAITTSADSSIP